MIVRGSPFAIDWSDKEAVIAYAKKLGEGNTVYKHPRRDTYNITHTHSKHLYQEAWVIYHVRREDEK